MYLPTDPNFQQVAGIIPQTCSLPYLPRECGDDTCHRPQISLQANHDVVESSLHSSNGALEDSEDVRITENCPSVNEPRSSNEAEQGEKTFSDMVNAEHVRDISTTVVGNSGDSIMTCDDNNGDLHSTGQETLTIPLQQVSHVPDYDETPTITLQQVSQAAVDEDTPAIPLQQISDAVDDGETIDGVAPDMCEEQAPKRRRLMPVECNGEGTVTNSDL